MRRRGGWGRGRGRRSTYSKLGVGSSVLLHCLLRSNSFGTTDHLDKGMALLLVHDASLDLSVAAEDAPQISFARPVIISSVCEFKSEALLT